MKYYCQKNNYLYAVFFALLLTNNPCYSDDPSSSTTPAETDNTEKVDTTDAAVELPKQTTLFERWFDTFENMRDKTSHHYMSMVHSLDKYFSGEKIEETSNGSYVKLDLKNTFYKSGDQTDGVSINARVDLPNTEKNLKLIFVSDPDENKTLEEKVVGNANGQRVQKESSIAGIEYTPEKDESQWEHSFTMGVKLRFNPIPFAQYKIKKQWQLNDAWQSQFRQSFWDFQDIGLGATTKVDFGRPMTKNDYFNAETVADFRDQDDKYYYGQTFSNSHRVTDTSSIVYWTGVLGESQPTSRVTNYLIGVDYRRSLYKDWLLLSVKPLLEYPREENWRPKPSITFDLQIYFTE